MYVIIYIMSMFSKNIENFEDSDKECENEKKNKNLYLAGFIVCMLMFFAAVGYIVMNRPKPQPIQ
jgi:hypothetical protein